MMATMWKHHLFVYDGKWMSEAHTLMTICGADGGCRLTPTGTPLSACKTSSPHQQQKMKAPAGQQSSTVLCISCHAYGRQSCHSLRLTSKQGCLESAPPPLVCWVQVASLRMPQQPLCCLECPSCSCVAVAMLSQMPETI
jgi:hypothetical protein